MLGAEQKLVQALYGLLQGADRLNVDHKIGLLTKPIRSSPDLCRDVNHHLEIFCIFCSQDQWLCAVFHHLLEGEHVGVVRWHICGTVSYTHLRAHETKANLVCRLLL